MASPLSGHTHGSNTPATMATHHSQSTYQQPYHEGQYEPGLMPADYQGKEVVTGQMQQGYYPAQNQHEQPLPPVPPVQGTPEKRICGLRKSTFFVTLLAALFLIAAIGAGAGAGVMAGQKCNSCSGSDASISGSPSGTSSEAPSGTGSSSSEPPSSTTSETATTTRPSSDSEFTAIGLPQEATGLGVNTPRCPGSNLTDTEIPGTGLVFRHECGINYPASDLGQIPMTNMNDCIMLCAAQNVRPQGSQGPCVGATWVFRNRQGLDGSMCWLKYQKNAREYDENVETAWLMQHSDFADD